MATETIIPPGSAFTAASGKSLYSIFNHIELPLGPDGTPCQYYEALRDEAMISPVGWSEAFDGFWVIAGYEECRNAMRRTEEFSNIAVIWPAYNTGDTGPLMIAGHDDPEHKLYRAMVQPEFSPRSSAAYEPALRKMTNRIIDGFIDDGVCDVSKELADEIPARLTALFLGLDPEDAATYRAWVEVMAHGIPGADDTLKVLGEMQAYFLETIEVAKRKPGEDVLSQLTKIEVDGAPLTDEELFGFCAVLLLGGIHNSAKLISNAFWHMGRDVELRRQLADHPRMIPSAVEEFLRYYTPAPIGRQVCVDRAEIGGVEMKRGDIVMLALPVANRDRRQFDNPDAFVPERDPNRHIGLGHGIHACLGASLIRVEAHAVLDEFLKRIPDFHLDTSEKSPRWQNGQTSGMTDVVLRFPPGGVR